jgi:hypothetical protein
MKAAQEMGIKVFGFLGCEGGKALKYCDGAFIVPSNNTGRIQEAHITAGHALMECIAKGKAHKRYEFGTKATIARTRNSGIILSALPCGGIPTMVIPSMRCSNNSNVLRGPSLIS